MPVTLTFSAPGLPSVTSASITLSTPTPTPATTYTALQAQIADWLNRDDLTPVIPDFIALVEAEMRRRLRRSSSRATITISSEETILPDDCAELKSIHLTTGIAALDRPLRVCTWAMLAQRRAATNGATGIPTDFVVQGQTLVVAPAPNEAFSALITYYRQLTPLTDTDTTNAILSEAPDAYLYGALMQAAPYLQHDIRIPVWQAKFKNALDQLNEWADREDFGSSLKPGRLPMSF
jgi:hypothetical protein